MRPASTAQSPASELGQAEPWSPGGSRSALHASRSTFHVSRFNVSRFTCVAFTLIELMVVIGIVGLVMAMGIPSIYRVWHREPMSKAINDVQEVCSHARARAILQGTMTEVVFHPREGRLEVAGAAPPPAAAPQPDSADEPPPPPPANSGLSAQISDRLGIEMLDVNLTEYKDAEIARVRFYPNGTCDEMTLILHTLNTEKNEWCKISLEVTTGLASVEYDPTKFK
jgi:prepilin-type N-terminal cleavage/methylation domain-containing protein